MCREGNPLCNMCNMSIDSEQGCNIILYLSACTYGTVRSTVEFYHHGVACKPLILFQNYFFYVKNVRYVTVRYSRKEVIVIVTRTYVHTQYIKIGFTMCTYVLCTSIYSVPGSTILCIHLSMNRHVNNTVIIMIKKNIQDYRQVLYRTVTFMMKISNEFQ